jgi:hypothetical protein
MALLCQRNKIKIFDQGHLKTICLSKGQKISEAIFLDFNPSKNSEEKLSQFLP